MREKMSALMPFRQVVRHRTLTPAFHWFKSSKGSLTAFRMYAIV